MGVRPEQLVDFLARAGDLKGKVGEPLRTDAKAARWCRTLVALRTDLELGINLNELRYHPSG